MLLLPRSGAPPITNKRSCFVQDESRRLSRLVDDLLNLVRADAGRVKMHVQEFYLNDLLAECCRAVHSLSAARRIALDSRSTDDAPIRGDEELVRRMVTNLSITPFAILPRAARLRSH